MLAIHSLFLIHVNILTRKLVIVKIILLFSSTPKEDIYKSDNLNKNMMEVKMNTQQLIHELEVLPPDLQKQVFDFVRFLKKQQQTSVKQRTVGEYEGKIRIAEDFDEPLGNDFWLGQK